MAAPEPPADRPPDDRPRSALDHGPQPIGERMRERGLSARDLVSASADQLNHRMVGRAIKGRQLTPKVVRKITAAFNAASDASLRPDELFSYVTAKGQLAREDGAAPRSDTLPG